MVNGSLPKSYPAKATGVLEDKRNIRITSLIPEFLRESWQQTPIAEPPMMLRVKNDWSLGDLRDLISDDVEYGGLLGPGSICIAKGQQTSVSAASGLFTWHSHTDEPCMFSLWDWVSFIISPSIWSLLITPEDFRVYVKVDLHLVGKARTAVMGFSRGIPSVELMNRRLEKFSGRVNAVLSPGETDKDIGKAVGISVRGQL